MKKKYGCLTAAMAVLLLFAVLLGGIAYRTDYAKTEVTASSSRNGRYTLRIYMIGEPAWPFGPAQCRFDLLEGSKRIAKQPFSVQDDGAAPGKGNFRIVWHADCVRVTVSASEQPDREYTLYFDGRTEQSG